MKCHRNVRVTSKESYVFKIAPRISDRGHSTLAYPEGRCILLKFPGSTCSLINKYIIGGSGDLYGEMTGTAWNYTICYLFSLTAFKYVPLCRSQCERWWNHCKHDWVNKENWYPGEKEGEETNFVWVLVDKYIKWTIEHTCWLSRRITQCRMPFIEWGNQIIDWCK